MMRNQDSSRRRKDCGGITQNPPGETFSYNSYHVTHLSAEAFGSFHGVDDPKPYSHSNETFRLDIPGGAISTPCIHEVYRLKRTRWYRANCSLCEIGSFKFVIDSGLHPKFAGSNPYPNTKKSKDFPLISYSHPLSPDHLGSLPLLSREQPDAPVILSYASSF